MTRALDFTLIALAAVSCALGCTDLQSEGGPADAGPVSDASDGAADAPNPEGGMDAAQTGPEMDAAGDGDGDGDGAAEPEQDAGPEGDGSTADAEMETECEDGFELEGPACVDIDECFLELDICHATATCQNVDGGYDCACPQGYVGGGRTNIACSPRVAAAISHSCAVLANGRVSCWGGNDTGQLGDGTNTTRLEPVTVLGVSDVMGISSNSITTCALVAAGTVSCWGGGFTGQLGDAALTESNRAVAIDGLEDVVALDVGFGGVCAVKSSGQVFCWGANSSGQLGNGMTSATPAYTPAEVMNISTAQKVAVGGDFACALLDDGSIRCWGANAWGQLGTGDMTPSTIPVVATDVDDAIQIDAAARHVCALLGNQSVKCWGLNTLDRVSVYGLFGANELAVGTYNSCAAHTERGSVTCWLYPYDARPEEGAAVIDLAGSEVLALAMGGDSWHACAVVGDGHVKCWGANGSGQLGDGTTMASPTTAVEVSGVDLW